MFIYFFLNTLFHERVRLKYFTSPKGVTSVHADVTFLLR